MTNVGGSIQPAGRRLGGETSTEDVGEVIAVAMQQIIAGSQKVFRYLHEDMNSENFFLLEVDLAHGDGGSLQPFHLLR